jgi:hypothetical protein
MHPYREIGIALEPSISKKKRSFYKTWYYKFLIWKRGPWKKRFIRCRRCLFITPEIKDEHPNLKMDLHYIGNHRYRHPKWQGTTR